MTQPTGVPADGSLKVLFVPVIADPANPTAVALTAGGVLDLSCYLVGGGYNPATDEQAIVDDRLCSRQTYEQPGRYTDSLEIGYVFNPKSPANNQAYLALPAGTTGFIVARWGVAFETGIAAGDIVDVFPGTAGQRRKNPPEANSMLRAMQKWFVTGKVRKDVVVV